MDYFWTPIRESMALGFIVYCAMHPPVGWIVLGILAACYVMRKITKN